MRRQICGISGRTYQLLEISCRGSNDYTLTSLTTADIFSITANKFDKRMTPKKDQINNTKIHMLFIFALLTMDVNFANWHPAIVALPKLILKGGHFKIRCDFICL